MDLVKELDESLREMGRSEQPLTPVLARAVAVRQYLDEESA